MKPHRYYQVNLPDDNHYRMFILSNGEEIYLHQNIFPWEYPEEHRTDGDTMSMITQLNQIENINLEDCKSDKNNQIMLGN